MTILRIFQKQPNPRFSGTKHQLPDRQIFQPKLSE